MTDAPLCATVTQRGVVLTPDDHVLVVKRAADGGWELPGGRLDRGEATVDGLARELREETALEPVVVAPVHTLAWVNDDGDGRFAVYYYCRGSHREVSLSAEHDAAEWHTFPAAGSRLSDPQAAAVDAAVTRHRRSLDADVTGCTTGVREQRGGSR